MWVFVSLLLALAAAVGTTEKDTIFPAELSCGSDSFKLATFAAGCFWSVELRFQRIPGVLATQVGYIGGHTERPVYEDVYAGRTEHAEAVQVTFDPSVVSYAALLDVFESKLPTSANHATVGSHLTFDQARWRQRARCRAPIAG